MPRMKYHGDFTTLAQVETFLNAHNVSSGEFFDLRVGDFFKLAGYTVFVAGLDTESNKGDSSNTAIRAHHITCVSNLGDSKMNVSDTTAGGYEGATTMQNFLSSKETELTAICGSHLLSRRCLTTNSVGSDGKSNDFVWTDHKLTLMSETQIYGSIQLGNEFDTGEAYEKLPIFNYLSPIKLFGRLNVWLRSVNSASAFAVSSSSGTAFGRGPSNSLIACAVFIIG